MTATASSLNRDLLRSMTEAQWQRSVVDDATTFGWEHLHVRKSRGHRNGEAGAHQTTTNIKGWPDLLLWNQRWPGRHIAAELKAERGYPEPAQKVVLGRLAAAGFEVYVWKPRHAVELDRILNSPPSAWPDGWIPTSTYPAPGGA